MSPFGRLCLLVFVGLILPARAPALLCDAVVMTILQMRKLRPSEGKCPVPEARQTLEEATSVTLADPVTENVHALTPAPEATPNQMEIHTQQPTEMDVLLTPGPGTDKSSTQGPTPPKTQLPRKNARTDPALRQTGSSEDDPFSYDEGTLRKRGLLVAAVLFITGIVILTSGKCRQLPRLCRSHDR
nr:FXYD domain-containing ion transport regulator 5 isoform X2 [Globicephala melas]